MVRKILSDHILFNECKFYLRKDLYQKYITSHISQGKPTYSCICTTIRFTKEWDLGDFSIIPSLEIDHIPAKKSLINFIRNPPWINYVHNPVLFGEVLSCLISFISLSPVKSPRSGRDLNQLSDDMFSDYCVKDAALTMPFLSSGNGAHNYILPESKEEEFIQELKELITILNSFDVELYSFCLEVLRLIHLSILVRRDDIGLAYMLLVSAIESVAQKAIKRNKVKTHPNEKQWIEKSKNDEVFEELFNHYKAIRGDNHFLSERFTKFILDSCPADSWDFIVHSNSSFSKSTSTDFFNYKLPVDTHPDDLNKILRNAYDYRSRFVHNATQPPHKSPNYQYNAYFVEERCSKNGKEETRISPTYELMLGLAKVSILKWIKTKT